MRKSMSALCILTLALSFSVLGCIDAVRYSPDEIKGFPQAIQENIKRGEIAPGMTQQQIRYSWGSPAEINVLEAFRGRQIQGGMDIYKDGSFKDAAHIR